MAGSSPAGRLAFALALRGKADIFYATGGGSQSLFRFER
jgi:hypothetical protein